MLRKFATISAIVFLVGCTPTAKDLSHEFTVMPEGMKDCKIYGLVSNIGSRVTAIRCPNSSTITNFSSGKSTHSVIVVEREQPQVLEVKPTKITVDGITYQKVD